MGGSEPRRVDIRLVAATNRNPQTEVREGRFREDLFYRLNVVPIHLSPLRERERDVIEIAHHLLEQYAKKENKDFRRFSADAESLMERYSWPGNVRELIHCIHRAVVMNNGEEIDYNILKPILENQIQLDVHDVANSDSPSVQTGKTLLPLKPLREIELDYIREALWVCNQVVPQAAAMLDISPSTIYRRLKDLESE